jgi:hypothetical protein
MLRVSFVRILVVGALLVVFGLVVRACIDLTDPFCQRGYIAPDGTCAWE